jgi:hypothetical protein
MLNAYLESTHSPDDFDSIVLDKITRSWRGVMAPPGLLQSAVTYAASSLQELARQPAAGAQQPQLLEWYRLAKSLDILVAATIETTGATRAHVLSAAMADVAVAQPELLLRTCGMSAVLSSFLRRKICPVRTKQGSCQTTLCLHDWLSKTCHSTMCA